MYRIFNSWFRSRIQRRAIFVRRENHTKQFSNSEIAREFNLAAISSLEPNTFTKHIRKLDALSWLTSNAKAEGGLFQIKELSTPDGFLILAERVVGKCELLVEECFSSSRRKIVQILDDISDEICRVADLAEFVRNVDISEEMKQAAEQAYGTLHHLVEKMNTNARLYQQAKRAFELGEGDETDRRVLKLYLVDFERSGVQLNDRQQLQYLQLHDDILHIENQFRNNAHKECTVPLKNLPENIRQRFGGKAVKLASAHSIDDDEFIREFIFRNYFRFDSEQEQLLDQLLKKRYELARLCGYSSYSHRALENAVLNKPELVTEYLQKISTSIRPWAERDVKLMQLFKSRLENNSQVRPVAPWDVARLETRFKSDLLNINQMEYTPYFSLGSCMDGLNIIFKSLFNVTLNKQNTAPGEVWHPSVVKLSVDHPVEGTVGYIYCDLFERKDKIPHDCHFTIQCSRIRSDGTCQLPIVVLHVNIPPSLNPNQPTLLTFGLAENLFHEFGHAMHSALARTRYQHASGTRCQTDIAEIPSQWMEYFLHDARVVKLFARHHQTGKVIPDDLLERLHISHNCFQAHRTQTQVVSSMFDHDFHAKYPLGQPYHDVYSSLLNKFTSLPSASSTYPYLKFYHLIDYGARFSSYIIARSIASKIWHDQFSKDPLSKSAGETLKSKFLQWGGERDPSELMTNLFSSNGKLTTDEMTKSISDEIENNVKRRDHYLESF